MGDDHDPGRVGAVRVVPADVDDDARRRTRGPGVPYGATMSMPWWKWAQLPSGGSHENPVHPKFWVTLPDIGQRSVPLYCDGMLPCWDCWRTMSAIRPASAFCACGGRGERLRGVRLVGRDLGVRRPLDRPGCAASPSRGGAARPCASLSSLRLLFERHLLGGRLDAQVVGLRPGSPRRSGGAPRASSWSCDDLLGEGLVLLADVDVVAHLGEEVGERPARQERLEQRRPVGVVGAPDAVGEQGLALGAARSACRAPAASRRGQLDVEHRRARATRSS